jgi:YbbR domain-containing protein
MQIGRYFLNYPGWKLLSLALAVAIWVTIHFTIQGSSKQPRNPVVTVNTLTMQLPITVMTAASDARVFKVHPSAVSVTIAGDVFTLEKVKEADVQVFVDLVGVTDAQGLRRKVQVNLPTAVTLVRVIPSDVSVEPLLSVDSPGALKKD